MPPFARSLCLALTALCLTALAPPAAATPGLELRQLVRGWFAREYPGFPDIERLAVLPLEGDLVGSPVAEDVEAGLVEAGDRVEVHTRAQLGALFEEAELQRLTGPEAARRAGLSLPGVQAVLTGRVRYSRRDERERLLLDLELIRSADGRTLWKPLESFEAAAPPLEQGNVFLESEPPGAQVFWQGRDTGHLTNALIEDVPEGEQAFLLLLDGHQPTTVRVEVRAGVVARARGALPPRPAQEGEAEPAEAPDHRDHDHDHGPPEGASPRVVATHPHRPAQPAPPLVEDPPAPPRLPPSPPEDTGWMTRPAPPRRGTLVLTTTPPGAKVWQRMPDGRQEYLGKTWKPLALQLLPGARRLYLETPARPEWTPREVEVVVGEGATRHHHVGLKRRPTFRGTAPGEVRTVSAGLSLAWIPPGSFLQGSDASEAGRASHEGPRRRVTMARGFWAGRHEVTRSLWASVMGQATPAGDQARLPAADLTHAQARAFTQALTRRERAAGRLPEGWSYRLPSEAEWEYMARAGLEAAPSAHARRVQAWFYGNSGAAPHPVGQRSPNPWGLFDVLGNVQEWTADRYLARLPAETTDGSALDADQPGGLRVLKGGSFASADRHLRPAHRNLARADRKGPWYGLRVIAAQD